MFKTIISRRRKAIGPVSAGLDVEPKHKASRAKLCACTTENLINMQEQKTEQEQEQTKSKKQKKIKGSKICINEKPQTVF
jgi:hypothetical protein